MKEIIVTDIPWTETLDLRSRVLRPGRPLTESHFVGDEDPTTFHMALKRGEDGRTLAVASFVKEEFPPLSDGGLAYRLRGMAVDPEFRRLRLGDRLIKASEEKLQKMHAKLLWFNARESAFSFYRSCGYEEYGELFDIVGIGPHKVMFKRF